jgi:chloride channel protein, CIC family
MTPDEHAEPDPLGAPALSILAIAVGVIAGLGAVAFRLLIGLFHNLLFLGDLSFHYDANIHTPPGPFGVGIILAPVVGAMGVAFLVKTFAPEAKGHGVPEVMDAIYYGRGRIRPVVALIKSIASALSIGSGGSVGREGPIIQIGSAFGSTLGQWIRMPTHQRVTLIAAGAGGGIAATFNTPVGGVAFAIELVLPAASAATMLPVALATVTATYLGRLLIGTTPAFDIPYLAIPAVHLLSPDVFVPFVVFGLAVGLLATLFVRSIYWAEDRFDALPGNYYTRHGLGMAGTGLLIYGLMAATGHYYVQGVGYATIEDVLRAALTSPGFLFLLVGLKLLATCLTLGSGASGGVFSPCLFLGASLGGAFGLALRAAFPDWGLEPSAFAIAGMAGMVAGTTGAIVTAVVMLFEMTRDYNVILPVLITAATAYTVRKHLSGASIYTLKLLRRGHVVPEGLESAIFSARRAADVMFPGVRLIDADAASGPDPAPAGGPAVLLRDGTVVGAIEASAATVSAPDPRLLARPDFLWVGQAESLLDVLAAMRERGAGLALVVREPVSRDPREIVGVIGEQAIAALVRRDAMLLGGRGRRPGIEGGGKE